MTCCPGLCVKGLKRTNCIHVCSYTAFLHSITPSSAALPLQFHVHPSAFVIHVPHKKAATYKATKQSTQWNYVRPWWLGMCAIFTSRVAECQA